ncbi:translational activator of cytochrome c oxidase 1 isoform X2 [Bombina bombina]|nr:translational activator of cytochrome c oxidase 1 isoform X2 [Bombina bombina]XP_053555589.1 translational activator of cytochrome c oxidase 1 isoform X2 [Bombina bombina]
MSGALGRICCLHQSGAWRYVQSFCQPLDRCSFHNINILQAALHTSSAVSAGHNKWSKVKHIKGPKDEARARLFAKLSMMIKVAVKEGGPNPDMNVNLSNLIEQCKQKNMPKTSIEAAIKGAEKAKPSSYALYEGRGPGGSSLLIEALTDNNSRSYTDFKSLMSKNGAALSDGARHFFDKKGVVTVQSCDKNGAPLHLEQALELAIEAGAEDVKEVLDEEDKGVYKFICEVPFLRDVHSQLTALGLVLVSSGPEFIPNTTVQLSDSDMELASQLLEIVNNHPEVMRVYDNIE